MIVQNAAKGEAPVYLDSHCEVSNPEAPKQERPVSSGLALILSQVL